MKLLSIFKNIVDNIQPDLCWFTTFNLNIELVERYVLPILTGKDSNELKRAEDFEALNLELDELNIKIWYDYRALDLKQGKRTTVDIFPVQTSTILKTNSIDSIFHPKIIFLKGKQTAYLITGSFNLTIAGWSCNRESIIIKEVKNKDNALQILNFFQKLNISNNDSNKILKWANQLPDNKSKWKFSHNFNTSNLIQEIKGNELHIWSPYFSKNTSELLNEIKQIGFEKINLIPDINQAQKVRITPIELKNISSDESFEIYTDSNINREKQNLFHAKVWLTESKIAIGSWNCSFKATGINTPFENRNIEAGIIDLIGSSQRNRLLSYLQNKKMDTIIGTSVEDLDSDWQNALNSYTMSCEINANWETFEYEIKVEEKYNKYTIALPHNSNQRFSIIDVNKLSFLDGFNRILKNKLFTIYNTSNEVAFIGYINEIGKKKRPVEGYVSLYDLFESLTVDPLVNTNKTRVKYLLDAENENGSEKEEIPFFAYKGHESYYMMFVAFQKLLDTIQENKSDEQKLEELGYRLPSSLINIKTLFNYSFIKALEEKQEDDILFHYFMAMEINSCIQYFNTVSSKPIDLIVTEQFLKLLKLDNKDLKFIKKAMTVK